MQQCYTSLPIITLTSDAQQSSFFEALQQRWTLQLARCKKVWLQFVFGSLDMAAVNAYVVHNASKELQLLFLEFQRDLAMGLLTLVVEFHKPKYFFFLFLLTKELLRRKYQK